jgi:hypothetical protein
MGHGGLALLQFQHACTDSTRAASSSSDPLGAPFAVGCYFCFLSSHRMHSARVGDDEELAKAHPGHSIQPSVPRLPIATRSPLPQIEYGPRVRMVR